MKNSILLLCAVFFLTVCDPHSSTKQDNGTTIKIGAIFSLSGYGAHAGQSELNATLLAAEDINAAGGINGHKLQIVTEDNRSEFAQTATAFNKLVSIDHVPAILGPNWAEFTEVVAPLAEKNKVVLLTASGYKKGIIENNDYVFSTCPRHSTLTQPLADYIVQKKHRKIASILSVNSFIESIYAALKDQLNEKGVEIEKEIKFNPGEFDYNTIITKLRQDEFDAIIAFFLENGEIANFLKQSKALNYSPQIYGSVAIATDPVILENKHLAEGVIFFNEKILDSNEFLNRYMNRFGSEPVSSAPRAYDNIFLIKAALKKCANDLPALRECLSGIEYSGLTGHLRFDKSGNVLGYEEIAYLTKVENGQFIVLR